VSGALARFVDLQADRDRVTAELARGVRRARQALEPQLDAVFGPAAGAAR